MGCIHVICIDQKWDTQVTTAGKCDLAHSGIHTDFVWQRLGPRLNWRVLAQQACSQGLTSSTAYTSVVTNACLSGSQEVDTGGSQGCLQLHIVLQAAWDVQDRFSRRRNRKKEETVCVVKVQVNFLSAPFPATELIIHFIIFKRGTVIPSLTHCVRVVSSYHGDCRHCHC